MNDIELQQYKLIMKRLNFSNKLPYKQFVLFNPNNQTRAIFQYAVGNIGHDVSGPGNAPTQIKRNGKNKICIFTEPTVEIEFNRIFMIYNINHDCVLKLV